MRVWRPRRHGQPVAKLGTALPEQPADIAVAGPRMQRPLPV
jgi:hypothetical protein